MIQITPEQGLRLRSLGFAPTVYQCTRKVPIKYQVHESMQYYYVNNAGHFGGDGVPSNRVYCFTNIVEADI